LEGAHTGRWWAAAVTGLLVACLASGCSRSASDDDDGAIATADPAATFAPLIVLAGDERWLPLGAEEFIDGSVLRWLAGACGDDELAAGSAAAHATSKRLPKLATARLGGDRPYSSAPRRPPDCRPRPRERFTTAEFTHPFDVLRANDIAFDEGFYLDLRDSARAGRHPNRVPVYYEVDRERVGGGPGLRVSYWLLFGRHAPALPRAVRHRFSREGDWERVAVLLRRVGGDRYRPFAVRYYGQGGFEDVAWRSARLVAGGRAANATHPVVYSARGSHVLLAAPGRYPYTVEVTGDNGGRFTAADVAARCPGCLRWRTWRLLRDVADEPWHGYGGGWGAAAGSDANSGPLGPSPFAYQSDQEARAARP
jgi:hypothetical protein